MTHAHRRPAPLRVRLARRLALVDGAVALVALAGIIAAGASGVLALAALVVLAGGGLVAAAAALVRARVASPASLAYGTVLIAWVSVHVVLVGYVTWLQPVSFAAGLIVATLAMHWWDDSARPATAWPR